MTSTLPTDALEGLTDAVALLLTQARRQEGLGPMQQTVADIRARVTQLFRDYIGACDLPTLQSLEEDLRLRLSQRRQLCIDGATSALRDHADYCLREVLVCFELARQICCQHEAVEIRQRLLADLPILRPFDYFWSGPAGAAASTATVTTSS